MPQFLEKDFSLVIFFFLPIDVGGDFKSFGFQPTWLGRDSLLVKLWHKNSDSISLWVE